MIDGTWLKHSFDLAAVASPCLGMPGMTIVSPYRTAHEG